MIDRSMFLYTLKPIKGYTFYPKLPGPQGIQLSGVFQVLPEVKSNFWPWLGKEHSSDLRPEVLVLQELVLQSLYSVSAETFATRHAI